MAAENVSDIVIYEINRSRPESRQISCKKGTEKSHEMTTSLNNQNHTWWVETGSGLISVGKLEPSDITDFKKLGYLYLSQYLPRELVQKCHDEIKEWKLHSFMSDQEKIKQSLAVMQVLEHETLFRLFEQLFESDVVPVPFKWLRKVGKGLYTGLHCDHVYVGYLHDRILTCWIPLSDISLENGSLIVSPKSHTSHIWDSIHQSYDNNPLDNDTNSGWLDPVVIVTELEQKQKPLFLSTNFKMGDVVVLDMKMMHMTAMNVTDEFRFSCDTRWVPL
jgi:hypothetical protein